MTIERPNYSILLKDDKFEIRQYEPMIVAVSQENDLKGGRGFSELFAYISGNNKDSRKISMTAPVLNDLGQGKLTTSFVMPREYRIDKLPEPFGSDVQLKEFPGRQIAALSFSGNVNPAKIAEKQEALLDWLKEKNITVSSSAVLARYNPPFIPGFFKHNELMIEVQFAK